MEQEIDIDDVSMPRVLIMQSQSKAVATGDFKAGDFVSSDTEELICGKGEPLKFVPIRYTKMYRIGDSANQNAFLRWEPFIPGIKRSFEEIDDNGNAIAVQLVYNFDVILVDQSDMPYTIGLKTMNTGVAKKLITRAFLMTKDAGLKPWEGIYALTSEHKLDNKKSYVVLGFRPTKDKMSKELKSQVEKWIKLLGQMPSNNVALAAPKPVAQIESVDSTDIPF
jgi:hypothetical protein